MAYLLPPRPPVESVPLGAYWSGDWASTVDAAIDAANLDPRPGIEFKFPAGTIDLSAGSTVPIRRGGIYFAGQQSAVTRLLGDLGTMFTWGDGATFPSDGGLSDVTLIYESPDTDSRVADVSRFARLRFERLVLDNVRQLLRLGTDAANQAVNIILTDVRGSTDPLAGSIVLDVAHGAGLYLLHVSTFAKNVLYPTNATDPHPAEDTTFMRLGQGSWDTLIAQSVVSNRYNRGLDISPGAGVNVSNLWLSKCIHDYNRSHGTRINPAADGGVRSVYIDSGWNVATDGHSVELAGAGTIANVHFDHVVARQAGKNNWRLAGTAMAGVQLDGCHGLAANRLAATNTGPDQDDLVILGSGVVVNGGRFGEDGQPYVGFTHQARYGVNVAANLDDVTVEGVEATGATGGWSVPATNTAGSFRRRVHGNKNTATTRPDYATSTTPAVPASGVSETWTGYTVAEFHIFGGTVTSVTKNGAQVSDGSGPAVLTLRPGDTYSVTYSVAPTVRRFVLP